MKFKKTFYYFDIKNYNKDFLIITPAVFFNFKDICLNYFKNLKNINLNNNIVFCTNDTKLKKFFLLNKIPFCFFNIKNNSFKTRFEWLETEKKLKVLMTLSVVEDIKCDFITSDADIFIKVNPIPHIRALKAFKKSDILCISDERYENILKNKIDFITKLKNKNTDQEKYGTLNVAFGYWKNSIKNKSFILDHLNYFNIGSKNHESGALQTIFNLLYKKHKIKIYRLSPTKFINGYSLDNKFFTHLNNSFLVHFNFVSRDLADIDNEIIGKINIMKKNKCWLIEDNHKY